MKAKDMREKSPEDLRELEKSLVRDAFQAKLKNFTNRLDDTSQIRKAKRDLARVKTLLGELHRSLAGNAGAPAVVAKAAASAPKKALAAPAAAKKKAPSKEKAPSKKAATSKARSEASK
jgi:large subunit ribosomal protein L29